MYFRKYERRLTERIWLRLTRRSNPTWRLDFRYAQNVRCNAECWKYNLMRAREVQLKEKNQKEKEERGGK